MVLNFREWFETRHAAVVHPDVKKWIDSADKLKQTIAKLKAIFKDKADKEKAKPPVKLPVEKPEKPEKKPGKPDDKDKEPEEKKPDVKPGKPDVKPEEKKPEPKKPFVGPPEPKNGEKPTKIVKAKVEKEVDERPERNSDTRFRHKVRD